MTSPPEKLREKVKVVYRDSLDVFSKARYMEKLKAINNKDPYEMMREEWSADFDGYPNIGITDIIMYLVHGVSAYTLDELKAYKSLDSYNYFVCGWVQEIRQSTINNKCVIIARVRHSQRSNDSCLMPWVIAEKNGQIMSGHCTCMAGLGEVCSHVGALLFAIDATVKMRDSKTVTEEKSYWLLPSAVKKVGYKTIQEIDFTSAKTKKRKLEQAITGDTPIPSKQRKLVNVKEPSPEELSEFYKSLKLKGKKPVILSLIPGYAKDYRPAALDKKYPKVLSELYDDAYATSDMETLLPQCRTILENLDVTEEESKNCEMDTRAQSKCKQWFSFRAGRITASKIKSACRTNPKTPAMSVVKDICYPSSKKFSNAATRWGCRHEETAKEQYFLQMNDFHENFNLRDCGVIVSPKYPFLAATPDGIASCDCCGEVVLEVKCPYCKKDAVISDDLDCLETRDGQLGLKRNHAYFYQVQCQLLLSGAECCDFIIWTKQDFVSERIHLDQEFCQEMVRKATCFFENVILPELVGKIFSKPRPLTSAQSDSDNNVCQTSMPQISNECNNQEVICVCRTVYKNEKVIGCDNENCPYVWLHFKCAKIKKLPRGKWYCSECKEKRK